MKRFQNGGLAVAAMGPPDPDEEMGPPVPTLEPEQIVERTTGVRPGMSITDLILQNKQANIDRLRGVRENLSARRADARQREQQDRWLALAQAMLQPTRTGAFGESLGTAAGALREQNVMARQAEAEYDAQLTALAEAEIAVENNMIDQMLKDSYYGANRIKGVHGSIQTMVHPEDQGKDVANQRIIFGAMMRDPLDPTSEMALRPLENPDAPGQYFEAASRLDPARAAALISATERAERSSARSEDMIQEGIARKGFIRDIRGAIQLLENAQQPLSFSGINRLKNDLANFIGVDFGDTTELTMIQRMVAEDFMSKLRDLKGPASDRDMRAMQAISVGISSNTEANYQRLRQMAEIYESAIARGVREAMFAARNAPSAAERRSYMDVVGDLWPSVAGNEWDPNAVPVPDDPVRGREAVLKLPAGAAYYVDGDWGGPIYYRTPPPEE